MRSAVTHLVKTGTGKEFLYLPVGAGVSFLGNFISSVFSAYAGLPDSRPTTAAAAADMVTISVMAGGQIDKFMKSVENCWPDESDKVGIFITHGERTDQFHAAMRLSADDRLSSTNKVGDPHFAAFSADRGLRWSPITNAVWCPYQSRVDAATIKSLFGSFASSLRHAAQSSDLTLFAIGSVSHLA